MAFHRVCPNLSAIASILLPASEQLVGSLPRFSFADRANQPALNNVVIQVDRGAKRLASLSFKAGGGGSVWHSARVWLSVRERTICVDVHYNFQSLISRFFKRQIHENRAMLTLLASWHRDAQR